MPSTFVRRILHWADGMLRNEVVMLRWGLMLAVIASIPIYAQIVVPMAFKLPPFQVIMYHTYVTDSPYRSMALMLGTVCVPMIIDTLFDVVELIRGMDMMKSELFKHVQDDENTRVKITRLNARERMLYLVGVSLQVLVLFTFDQSDDQRVIVLNFVRVNCSFYVGKLMAYIAVMCFLQRCTTTWTPLRTVIAITFMAVGVICKNLRYTVSDPDMRGNVSVAGSSLMSISFSFQVILIFLCLIGYLKHQWLITKTPKDNTLVENDEIHDRLQAIDTFYENYVPAGHMIVLFFDICCDFDFIYDTVDAYQYWDVTINLAVLFVLTILVIVLEGRIKHNEVVRVMLRSLLATKTSYEQILKVKKEHVRFISHEIRSPLSAAISGIQILENSYARKSTPADGDRIEIVNDVHLSCVAALDILNDLLTFEKMESGLMDLRKEIVSPITVIRDSIQIFVLQARSKNIGLELVTSGMHHKDDSENILGLTDGDVLSCDRFKVAQVVRNFVSNAIKFTPSGGKVTIHACFIVNIASMKTVEKREKKKYSHNSFLASLGRVVSSAHDDHHVVDGSDKEVDVLIGNLRVRVTDTGAGIAKEDQEKLFKTVVQFRPEVLQAGGGSGFGMFISAGIVSAHGGIISVRSEGEGHGTTFSFTIPMTRMVDRLTGTTKASMDDTSNISLLMGGAADTPVRGPRHGSLTGGQIFNTSSTTNIAGKVNEMMDRVDEHEDEGMMEGDNVTHFSNHGETAVVPFASSERINDDDPVSTLLYHVLVVDDSLMNRKMLASLLKSVGHTCEQAVDGLKAVEAVRAKRDAGSKYDAILMDFVMPNMEGPAATAEIRAMGIDWPIFGLTGNGMEPDIQTFLKAGANKVFVKPMYIEDFETTMHSLSTHS